MNINRRVAVFVLVILTTLMALFATLPTTSIMAAKPEDGCKKPKRALLVATVSHMNGTKTGWREWIAAGNEGLLYSGVDPVTGTMPRDFFAIGFNSGFHYYPGTEFSDETSLLVICTPDPGTPYTSVPAPNCPKTPEEGYAFAGGFFENWQPSVDTPTYTTIKYIGVKGITLGEFTVPKQCAVTPSPEHGSAIDYPTGYSVRPSEALEITYWKTPPEQPPVEPSPPAPSPIAP